jgi:hypothetical protein
MHIRALASSAAVIAGLAALPLAPATAQYYYGPTYYPAPAYRPAYRTTGSNACWFPLFWPFCAAGAVVGTAGAIASAPFQAAEPQPYYYSYGTPYYTAPYSYNYYGPG